MRRSVKILFLSAFTIYLAPSWLVAQCRVTLDGRVVDERNFPVSAADVFLVEDMRSQGTRYLGPFETDSNGMFHHSVDISRAGTYFVSAKKEAAGYPNARLLFYNDREPQEFELNCDANRSGIVVRLGPKAGDIRRISVVDSSSGEVISNASITLQRLSSPLRRLPRSAFSITTSVNLMPKTGKYSGIPVPPGVDISYQISAPGYTTSTRKKINLRPEQGIEIKEKLKRATPLLPPSKR